MPLNWDSLDWENTGETGPHDNDEFNHLIELVGITVGEHDLTVNIGNPSDPFLLKHKEDRDLELFVENEHGKIVNSILIQKILIDGKPAFKVKFERPKGRLATVKIGAHAHVLGALLVV